MCHATMHESHQMDFLFISPTYKERGVVDKKKKVKNELSLKAWRSEHERKEYSIVPVARKQQF